MGKAAKADMAQYAPEKIWDQWDDLMKKVIEKQLSMKGISENAN